MYLASMDGMHMHCTLPQWKKRSWRLLKKS